MKLIAGIKQDERGQYYMLDERGNHVEVEMPIKLSLGNKFEKLPLPINEATGLPVEDDGTYYRGGFSGNDVRGREHLVVERGGKTYRVYPRD